MWSPEPGCRAIFWWLDDEVNTRLRLRGTVVEVTDTHGIVETDNGRRLSVPLKNLEPL